MNRTNNALSLALIAPGQKLPSVEREGLVLNILLEFT